MHKYFHHSKVSPMVVFVLLLTVGLAMGQVRSVQGISCEIRPVRTKYAAVDRLAIAYSMINNTDDTLYLCKWKTPLEGFDSNMFTVTKDEEEVTYIGRLIKRGSPSPDDYVLIAPKGRVSGTIDLSEGYAVYKEGDYTVTFNSVIYDVGKETPLRLAAKKAYAPQEITSAVVNFKLTEVREYKAPEIPMRKADSAATKVTYSGGCTTSEKNDLKDAVIEAKRLLTIAILQMEITPQASQDTCRRYTTWFGTWTAARWNTVKNNFQKILDALTYQDLEFDCSCTGNYYAYVYPASPYKIYLCNAFWNAPMTGTDSKAGTIIHEMSHFYVVASTDDHAYGHTNCKNLASSDPTKAIDNADSHEYFCENTPEIGCYRIRGGPQSVILWLLVIPLILVLEFLRRRYLARSRQI